MNNKDTIWAQFPNAYIILYNTEVLGPYRTILEAYRVAFAKYKIGSFLVKYCGNLEDIGDNTRINSASN